MSQDHVHEPVPETIHLSMPLTAAELIAWQTSALETHLLVKANTKTLESVDDHLAQLNGHVATLTKADAQHETRISVLAAQSEAQAKMMNRCQVLMSDQEEENVRRREKGRDRWVGIALSVVNAIILIAVLFVLSTLVQNLAPVLALISVP